MSWIGVAPASFTAASNSSRITSGRFSRSRSHPWYSHSKCRPSARIVSLPPIVFAEPYARHDVNASSTLAAMVALLDALLAATPHAATSALDWFAATTVTRTARPTTIERALLGGALADRVAFAFAAGYTEALRYLVPSLDGIAAL